MTTLKRLISALTAGCLLFALTACSQPGAQSAPEESGPQESSVSQAPEGTRTPEPPAPSAGGEEASPAGGTLVVYFSATGNTETIAGYLAEALGADVFEITPAQPYTSDDLNWTDDNSRVSREHADPSLQTVELTTTEVENWDSYDTVFIGYPIWWGAAAWPVSSFVAANDFTGKTVIPFCTSSSSGLGQSGELLAQLTGTGDWLDGERFRGSSEQSDVEEWLGTLGLDA